MKSEYSSETILHYLYMLQKGSKVYKWKVEAERL